MEKIFKISTAKKSEARRLQRKIDDSVSPARRKMATKPDRTKTVKVGGFLGIGGKKKEVTGPSFATKLARAEGFVDNFHNRNKFKKIKSDSEHRNIIREKNNRLSDKYEQQEKNMRKLGRSSRVSMDLDSLKDIMVGRGSRVSAIEKERIYKTSGIAISPHLKELIYEEHLSGNSKFANIVKRERV